MITVGIVAAAAFSAILIIGLPLLQDANDPFVGAWELVETEDAFIKQLTEREMTISRVRKRKDRQRFGDYRIAYRTLFGPQEDPGKYVEGDIVWMNPVFTGEKRFSRDGPRLLLTWTAFGQPMRAWYERSASDG